MSTKGNVMTKEQQDAILKRQIAIAEEGLSLLAAASCGGVPRDKGV